MTTSRHSFEIAKIGRDDLRFDCRYLVWLLVLSFIFWSAFWTWSYRPAKPPLTLILKESAESGSKP